MPKGGKRVGAGRRPTKSIALTAVQPGGPDLVRRIFDRIPELNRPGIQTIEDYILFALLGATDVRVNKETVLALFWTLFGKPAQSVQISGPDGGAIAVAHTIRFGDGNSDKK